MVVRIKIEGTDGADARRQLLDLLLGGPLRERMSEDDEYRYATGSWYALKTEADNPVTEQKPAAASVIDEDPAPVGETAEQAVERKKRHRRTKAEMAAARAVEDNGGYLKSDTITLNPLSVGNGAVPSAGSLPAEILAINPVTRKATVASDPNPHIGSSLDEVLAADGTLEEINAQARIDATRAETPVAVGPFDHLDQDPQTGEMSLTYASAFTAYVAANKDATPADFNRSLLRQLTVKEGVGMDGANALMAAHQWTMASKIPETERQTFFDVVQEKLRG
jgi:hypothetical protein